MRAGNTLLVSTPAELSAAARNASPGDEVVLRDGVWRDADLLAEARGSDSVWAGDRGSGLPFAIPTDGGDRWLVPPPVDVQAGNNIAGESGVLATHNGYRRDESGILRPSPDAALRIPPTHGFTQVPRDIDGQVRPWPSDSGCDHVSLEPRLRWLHTRESAGPRWYQP